VPHFCQRKDLSDFEKVQAGLPFLFYVIAFCLMLGWTDIGVWVGKCGNPAMNQSCICLVFGGVSLFAALWAWLRWRNRSAAIRFFVSGFVPLFFPWLICHLKSCLW
jgi:hypothetical protein